MKRRKRLAYFDIEAIKWTKFELGMIYFPEDDTEEVFIGKNGLRDMVRFFELENVTAWAHNAGGYDSKHLVPVALKNDTLNGACIINSKFFYARIGNSMIRDTLFFLKGSLKKLGEKFGYPKIEIDYEKIDAKDARTVAYLRNDCRILYEIHRKALDFLELQRAGTIGSAAIKIWSRYIYANPFELSYKGIFRKAYIGGRIEIFDFDTKGKMIKSFDANSLYPFIMRDMAFPVGPYYRDDRITKKTAAAEVIIDIPPCYVPPAPMYLKKLFFPTGQFRTTLAGPELQYIRKHIKSVIWAVSSRDFEPITRAFVKALWKKRKAAQRAGDSAGEQMFKDAMNNLSGKFAEREEKRLLKRVPVAWKGLDFLDEEKGLAWVDEYRALPYAQPIISAWITSGARVYMHPFLVRAAEEGELFYTATDCIQTTADMKQSKELGGFKLEKQGPAKYLGCGIYSLGDYHKIRGYRSLPTRKMSGEKLAKHIFSRLDAKAEVNLSMFDGAMGVLEKGRFSKRRLTKHLKHIYDKRVLTGGGHTRAWTAEELRAKYREDL